MKYSRGRRTKGTVSGVTDRRVGKGTVFATKTVSVVPPPIVNYFDSCLLSYPMPGMKEPSHYLDLYEGRIKAKYKPGSRRYREYELIMEVYEELYEWKKAAEAHGQKEITKETKGPAIPVEAINRLRGGLGRSIRSFLNLGKNRAS